MISVLAITGAMSCHGGAARNDSAPGPGDTGPEEGSFEVDGEFVQVAVDSDGTGVCALGADGSVRCWSFEPDAGCRPHPFTGPVTSIDVGDGFVCGLVGGTIFGVTPFA